MNNRTKADWLNLRDEVLLGSLAIFVALLAAPALLGVL